jgi:HEPN domain-containing protein
VAKAEEDFGVLERECRARKKPAYSVIGFHAQQCAEKYLKALLGAEDKEIPRTHSIGDLTRRLRPRLRPDLSPEEEILLTDYAVSTRYPSDYEAISLADARRAVRIARRVRKHVRSLLPPAAVRQE